LRTEAATAAEPHGEIVRWYGDLMTDHDLLLSISGMEANHWFHEYRRSTLFRCDEVTISYTDLRNPYHYFHILN
jgi:hypothetical protein